ncbi:MAG: hypothetical protein AAFR61_07860 [Bacteroidota bacterium]
MRSSSFRWQGVSCRVGLLCLLLSLPYFGTAQSTAPGRWSVQAALGNQTVGFPLQNLAQAWNPGLTDLGIGFSLNRGSRHQWQLGTQTAWLPNTEVGNSLLMGLRLGYRYQHASGLQAGLSLDMGSLRQSYARESLVFDEVLGTYQEQEARPINSGFSGFSLELGYAASTRYRLFLRNQFYFQLPYFATEAFPVLPQNLLSIGLSYQLPSFRSTSTQ